MQRGLLLGASAGAMLGLVDMLWSLHRSASMGLSIAEGVWLVVLSALIVGGAGLWTGCLVGAGAWFGSRFNLPFGVSWSSVEALFLSATGAALAVVLVDFFRVGPMLSWSVASLLALAIFFCLLALMRSPVGPFIRGPLWFLESVAMVYVAGRVVYEISRTVTMGGLHAHVVLAMLIFVVMAFYVRFSAIPARFVGRGVAVFALSMPLALPFFVGATASHQTRLILSERTALTYRILWRSKLYRVGAERQMPPISDCEGAVEPPRLGPQVELDAIDEAAPPTADHVVLIVIDTLRHDRLGGERDGVALTPNLDRFADEATRFDHAYATTPSTVTTVGSMLTGLATGLGDLPRWDSVEEHTIVDRLAEKGVFTASVPAHSVMDDLVSSAQLRDDEALDAVMSDEPHTAPLSTEGGLRAAQSIAAHERGLMVVHYFDLHEPYYPHPGKFDFGRSDESRYDAELAFTDRAVGELVDGLDAILPDDHAVIIVTDHGEEFWDHGYRYHAVRLYDESVKLVALMRRPGQNRAETIDKPVSSADVAPTILDLFGLPITEDLEGRSWLRPLPEDRRIHLHILNRKRVGFVDDRYKFIVNRRPRILELYDLKKDADERVNLADERPDEVARYYCDMVQWKREREIK